MIQFPGLSCILHFFGRFSRRQNGWWRRRGRSHYTIDLETAIRLAKDEYEKEKKAQAVKVRSHRALASLFRWDICIVDDSIHTER